MSKTTKAETAKAEAKAAKAAAKDADDKYADHVRMVRDEFDDKGNQRIGTEARVHPDEVQNWLDADVGWRVAK